MPNHHFSNSNVGLQHLILQLEFDFLIFIFSNLFRTFFGVQQTVEMPYSLRNRSAPQWGNIEGCVQAIEAMHRKRRRIQYALYNQYGRMVLDLRPIPRAPPASIPAYIAEADNAPEEIWELRPIPVVDVL